MNDDMTTTPVVHVGYDSLVGGWFRLRRSAPLSAASVCALDGSAALVHGGAQTLHTVVGKEA